MAAGRGADGADAAGGAAAGDAEGNWVAVTPPSCPSIWLIIGISILPRGVLSTSCAWETIQSCGGWRVRGSAQQLLRLGGDPALGWLGGGVRVCVGGGTSGGPVVSKAE